MKTFFYDHELELLKTALLFRIDRLQRYIVIEFEKQEVMLAYKIKTKIDKALDSAEPIDNIETEPMTPLETEEEEPEAAIKDAPPEEVPEDEEEAEPEKAPDLETEPLFEEEKEAEPEPPKEHANDLSETEAPVDDEALIEAYKMELDFIIKQYKKFDGKLTEKEEEAIAALDNVDACKSLMLRYRSKFQALKQLKASEEKEKKK